MSTFPYFELVAKKILLKLLNPNLKSYLQGFFNFWFPKILINIGECNSRFKHTHMIYICHDVQLWFQNHQKIMLLSCTL
jgi:hypothetical protein